MRVHNIALIVIAAVSLALTAHAQGQARTVFSGLPSLKVTETGTERLAEVIRRDQAANLGAVIRESLNKSR